eukprot:4333343-Pyramimonas_sp.AAC.1
MVPWSPTVSAGIKVPSNSIETPVVGLGDTKIYKSPPKVDLPKVPPKKSDHGTCVPFWFAPAAEAPSMTWSSLPVLLKFSFTTDSEPTERIISVPVLTNKAAIPEGGLATKGGGAAAPAPAPKAMAK